MSFRVVSNPNHSGILEFCGSAKQGLDFLLQSPAKHHIFTPCGAFAVLINQTRAIVSPSLVFSSSHRSLRIGGVSSSGGAQAWLLLWVSAKKSSRGLSITFPLLSPSLAGTSPRRCKPHVLHPTPAPGQGPRHSEGPVPARAPRPWRSCSPQPSGRPGSRLGSSGMQAPARAGRRGSN